MGCAGQWNNAAIDLIIAQHGYTQHLRNPLSIVLNLLVVPVLACLLLQNAIYLIVGDEVSGVRISSSPSSWLSPCTNIMMSCWYIMDVSACISIMSGGAYSIIRHPTSSDWPDFKEVCVQLSLPDTKLLRWTEDSNVHPEADKLGAVRRHYSTRTCTVLPHIDRKSIPSHSNLF